MDKSTNRAIESVFANRLRASGQINQEFKATQITSGASGVLAYTAANPVDWDRIESLPYVDPMSGGTGIVELTITFTGDSSQKNPFAIPFSDMRVNGTAAGNMVIFKEGQWWWNFGDWTGSYIQSPWYDAPSAAAFSDVDRMKWTIYFYYVGTITYYLKLGARASCPGTLTVTRTI